jgi:Ca2+-binding RTX toxin-like protein
MATDGDDIVRAYDYQINGVSFDGGAGQDTFELMGGGYFDITQMTTFANFEVIQGGVSSDTIRISGNQIATVETVNGGYGRNVLYLTGPTVDLTGKSISGFERIVLATAGMTLRTDDLDVALLADGGKTDNDGITLENITLTEEQRLSLLNHGIDRITDATGVTTVNQAAQVMGLAGDRVIVTGGGQYTPLDIGGNAVVTDDRGTIQSLKVSLNNPIQHDVLGIFFLTASDRVTYQTLGPWSRSVSVDGVPIGSLESGSALSFTFNANATPERVTQVLRAIAFRGDGQGYLPVAEANVDIVITDAGGRVTQSLVRLENANTAPVGLDLLYSRVAEGSKTGSSVGLLTAGDYNEGDTPFLRFSLIDDAGGRFTIDNGRLVVTNGAKLDYEQAQTHQVVVRVTDQRGLYQEKVFTIMVTDVLREELTGSDNSDTLFGGRDKDTLSGGIGDDSLSGGTGDDVLRGGSGKDVLTGGSAADKLYGGADDDILYGGDGKDYLHGSSGRDAFAFTSKATPANVDRIADFNVKDDLIYLDNRIFTKLGKKGSEASPSKLSAKFFTVGEKAKDRYDYIIHDRKKGVLLYDADGSGSKYKAAEIATVSKNLKISVSDVFVI